MYPRYRIVRRRRCDLTLRKEDKRFRGMSVSPYADMLSALLRMMAILASLFPLLQSGEVRRFTFR